MRVLDALWQDVRTGLRGLAHNRGFTAAAVLSLGLGIGANTTIFTWVNAVLLEPLPGVPDAADLLVVDGSDPRQGSLSFSCPDYDDYAQTPGLGLLAHEETALSLGGSEGDGAERVWAQIVSENYFDVLRVKPALGRGFTAEDRRARAAVAVISDGLWKRRFGGDPAIVGRSVTLNTHPFTIVGVAPAGFGGSVVGLSFAFWVPLGAQASVMPSDRLQQRGQRWLQAMARPEPGMSPPQVRAALQATARRLAETYPVDQHLSVTAERFWSANTGTSAVLGPVLLVLAAVVAVVLLIACANVANLLIARATRRRREIAVRLALGASRARLVRQLLTESLLLAAAGGAAGVAFALWGSGLMVAFAPRMDFPIALTPAVDARALAFTGAVAVATTLLFGLAPALQATRAAVSPTLRDEQGSVAGGTRARLRSALVVTQVALSLVLLVSAGLLVRSVRAAAGIDPGFNPRGILLASMDLYGNGYTPATGTRFYASLVEKLKGLPGVKGVTLMRRAPLGIGGSSSSTLKVEGYAAPDDRPAWAQTHVVGPEYFATVQARLTRGRDFAAADAEGAPLVVIVDEEMARRYWGGRDPVGSRVHLYDQWRTVVGLAGPMKYRTFSEAPAPHVFVPVLQVYTPNVTMAVRADGDPLALAPALREQVRALDPQLPLFAMLPFEEHARAASFQQRMAGSLLAGFGALALLLATIGLYGVLAYAVGQRTREIGIRMALGGGRGRIFALVITHGLRLTGIGVVLGMAAAAAATRGLSRLLVGVSPTDPLTFVAVAAILAAVAFLACAVPARRATRIDPAIALRYE